MLLYALYPYRLTVQLCMDAESWGVAQKYYVATKWRARLRRFKSRFRVTYRIETFYKLL